MNETASLQRDLIHSGIEKVWNKLTSPPADQGESLNYWEWVPGVGMYGVTKKRRF